MKLMRTVKTDTIEVWKAKIIEQEHIKELLEDIKAEIENIREEVLYSTSDYSPNEVLDILDDICIEIIDKHIGKAESEEE